MQKAQQRQLLGLSNQLMRKHLMAEQILSQDRLKQVLDYDLNTGFFKRKNLYGPKVDIAGHISTSGHRQIMVDKKLYMAHRLAWLWQYGEFPSLLVDHKNKNPDDNRICNLRLATNSENQQNTRVRVDNKTGAKGISFSKDKNCWRSRISIKGHTFHLGYFENIDEAIHARKIAENQFFTHHKE
jgi:hypothetical protein